MKGVRAGMEARVRPARTSDREPLMSFIKDVWGGHDYIPYVWDSWLTDPKGRMFVVEADGRPVGMNRVRFLEDGSAWFEGARVHPDYRGLGLASMLGENSMKVAKERGVAIFRLTSGSRNWSAHRQIARIKFHEVARFSVYEPSKEMKLSPGRLGERVPTQGAPGALGLMRQSPEFQLGKGFEWHDFNAVSLTPEVVGNLARRGAVLKHRRAVAVVQEGGEGSGVWEEVGFLGGPVEDASELVLSLLGRNKKAKDRYVFLPQRSPLIHALRVRGLVRNFSMVLFERTATKG